MQPMEPRHGVVTSGIDAVPPLARPHTAPATGPITQIAKGRRLRPRTTPRCGNEALTMAPGDRPASERPALLHQRGQVGVVQGRQYLVRAVGWRGVVAHGVQRVPHVGVGHSSRPCVASGPAGLGQEGVFTILLSLIAVKRQRQRAPPPPPRTPGGRQTSWSIWRWGRGRHAPRAGRRRPGV